MLRITTLAASSALACTLLASLPMAAAAQTGTDYKATIWVDPDGCEHWVMDGGIEGFMSAHLDKDGMPVCRKLKAEVGACKVLSSDSLFSTGSAVIPPSGKEELTTYFDSISGSEVIIDGHTDAVGGDSYNLDLSVRRAQAVAAIAEKSNVSAQIRGFGEQVPIASNATAEGRAKNRRVEISCAVAQ